MVQEKVVQRVVLTPAPRCQFLGCCLREHKDQALDIGFQNIFPTVVGALRVEVLLERHHQDPRIEQTRRETDQFKEHIEIFHSQPDQAELLLRLVREHGEIGHLEVITTRRPKGANPQMSHFDVLGFCTIELEGWKFRCRLLK